jgi:hypothetical protein
MRRKVGPSLGARKSQQKKKKMEKDNAAGDRMSINAEQGNKIKGQTKKHKPIPQPLRNKKTQNKR